jgi:hypothetical protein
VFPEPDDAPTKSPKFAVDGGITPHITLQLLIPIANITLWSTAVYTTAVPKTSVNEYRKAILSENKIRLSDQFLVSPPPLYPIFLQNRTEFQLGGRVAAAFNCGHALGTLALRQNITHARTTLFDKRHQREFLIGRCGEKPAT